MLSDTPANCLLVCVSTLVENDSKRNCTLLWLIVLPLLAKETVTALVGDDTGLLVLLLF